MTDRVKSSESIFSLGMVRWVIVQISKNNILVRAFKGVMRLGFIIQTKHVLSGGKMGTDYFAVLNAPNWIGIDVLVNGEPLDLNTATIHSFTRVLDMQAGLTQERLYSITSNGVKLEIVVRFLAMFQEELGCKYRIQLFDQGAELTVSPYVDGHKNIDSNWDDPLGIKRSAMRW